MKQGTYTTWLGVSISMLQRIKAILFSFLFLPTAMRIILNVFQICI